MTPEIERARALVKDLAEQHPEQLGRYVAVDLESLKWWSAETVLGATRLAKAAGAGRLYVGRFGHAAVYVLSSPR